MTPIIETMRSLLTEGTPGPDIWALAWAAGILVVFYTLALGIYRRRAPVPAAQQAAARHGGSLRHQVDFGHVGLLTGCDHPRRTR
jgi:hypothetical protein